MMEERCVLRIQISAADSKVWRNYAVKLRNNKPPPSEYRSGRRLWRKAVHGVGIDDDVSTPAHCWQHACSNSQVANLNSSSTQLQPYVKGSFHD